MKLDRIDINILSRRELNGRLSNIDLADAVGLSSSLDLQRVGQLEKAGSIPAMSKTTGPGSRRRNCRKT